MTAVAAARPGSLVEEFRYGLDAPICLTWELDLRLQPGLRALPVQLGPPGPARAQHRRVQGADRRARADAGLLRQHRRRRADRAGRTSGNWSTTRPPTTSGSSSPPTACGSRRRSPRGWPASDYVDVQISLDGATAEVNDAVRGRGSFAMALRAMQQPGRRRVRRLQDLGGDDPAQRRPARRRSRPSPTATARSCGSPGCGRPAAAPTSGTSCTRPPASSASSTTGWSRTARTC